MEQNGNTGFSPYPGYWEDIFILHVVGFIGFLVGYVLLSLFESIDNIFGISLGVAFVIVFCGLIFVWHRRAKTDKQRNKGETTSDKISER